MLKTLARQKKLYNNKFNEVYDIKLRLMTKIILFIFKLWLTFLCMY